MYAVTVILIILGAATRFVVSRGWGIFVLPVPDSIATNGMSYVDQYIHRLLSSRSRYTSLSIFATDGHRGLGLDYELSDVSFEFTIKWREEPEQEQTIRRLFEELGISPSEDYMAGNGNSKNVIRILSYPVCGDAVLISKLCKRVLRHIYGISDEEALNFTYKECK
ncbi:MAG TPA: hypothetical protein VF600_02210 [Abditibacteriaceae bacterium]|jgi:hypothetical protein